VKRRSAPAPLRSLTAALAAALLVGCGEAKSPPDLVAVNSYLNALAEGNYSNACGLLEPGTEAALIKSAGKRISCPEAFHRCLPDSALIPKQDQSQLLYATVDLTVTGKRALASVAGNPVARAVQRVTLAKHGQLWKLTSYGVGLKGCKLREQRRAGRRHAALQRRKRKD
jgi:hypothetical protein